LDVVEILESNLPNGAFCFRPTEFEKTETVKPLARSGRFIYRTMGLVEERYHILNSHENGTEVGKRDKPRQ
jgi:hypothetical protein